MAARTAPLDVAGQQAQPSACIRVPDLTTDLILSDDRRAFDAGLARLMKAGPDRITVDLAMPVSVSQQPPVAQPWLRSVQKSGGAVEEAPIVCSKTKTRSVFGFVRRTLKAILGMDDTRIYDVAKGYNATLYYDQEQQRIRQIVFEKRAAG